MNTTRCHTLTRLLLSCLLLVLLTVTASSADAADIGVIFGDRTQPFEATSGSLVLMSSGTCGAEGDGSNLTWTLDDEGTLTISGSGAISDYERGKTPWSDLCGDIKNVIVGGGVTRVGNNAFYDCKEITAVLLPDSLRSLGNAAFGWCYNLKSIVLPQGLQSIGISAFYWNGAIPEITIPGSVQEIGAGAFARCVAMEAIYVEKDNAVYCDIDGVLFDKAGTTLFQYPAGRAGAYRIPDGVIGCAQGEKFACAGKLTELTIPASMQKIGDFCFCGQLKSILVENGNPSYKSVDGVLFSADGKTLVAYPPAKRDADYTIPSGVEQIGDYAFHSVQVTQITVPDSVEKIGRMGFGYSDGLKQVIFEGSAPRMGENVFEGKRSVRVYYVAGASGWESYVRSDLLAFADKADIQHYDAAACLQSLGVEEASTESFEPQMAMTRRQVCKYIARLCGTENYKGSVSFSDVPADNAFYPYIAFCVENGYMRGTGDEIFSPDDNVTMYQFAKTLLLVLGYDEQAEGLSVQDWMINTINLAGKLGLFDGVNTPYSGTLSKDDMCQMLYSALFAKTVGYYSNGERYEGDILLNKNDYDVRSMVWCGSKTPVLQEPLAESSFDLVGSRNTGSRYGETPLCDLVVDGLYWYANTVLGQNVDIAILNGGGVRTDIPSGAITKDMLTQVMPFGNTVGIFKVTGEQLLEAMEAACQKLPSGTSALLHVAGMRYAVHSDIPFQSTGEYLCSISYEPYYKPASIGRRVEIFSIGGKIFSTTDTYTIAANSYLMEGGDAYYTFAEGTDRIESSTTLVDATALYLSNGLNGVVPQKYSKTDGRVTVVRSCDAVLTAESQISGSQDIPSTAFQIENVCENLQEYVLIASYYSDAHQQIAVEVKETGPLSQGNVQTLRLNGCESAACAKLYVVHKNDLTPACTAVQYGEKTVSPVSAIEPLAQTHTARSIPSVDGVEV